MLNRKLQVVYASDSWLEAFEFTREEAFGTSILKLAPNAPEKWRNVLQDCLSGKGGHRGTDRFVGKGNREFWFEFVNEPWYDEDENIIGVLIQVTDITDRVHAEIEHEKTSILLEAQSEMARIGSWEYNALTDELKWCDMTRQIHEVPDSFVPTLENGINFYKEGYSRNAISMAVFKAMETGESWKEKLQLITQTGKEIWVLAAGKPIYKDGIYMGLIGTFQDVTELSLSAQKTAESEKLLRTVVDTLPINVYIKDLESRKILVNKAECNYLGAKHPTELLGKNDYDLYTRKVADISREEDLFVMNNGQAIMGRETISERKDGTVTHFLSSKIPLYDTDNEVYGLLGISLDITELKQKENELRNLINVTSQQNKKLLNFAHIVSHNLRSHTANFSMLLDFLTQETDESERSKILGMLTEASDNLLDTLENLNEVVAINSNINLEMEEVPLNKAVKAVQQNLSGFLMSHHAVVRNEIPGGATLRAVPAYLESILMNFITNAVKYRHPDRLPEIRLTLERRPGERALIIEDNGLGIDLKKHGDKLFGMYKTFHEHPDARGIGLFITKNQVEAMGGRIRTRSEVGKGTAFKIVFYDQD